MRNRSFRLLSFVVLSALWSLSNQASASFHLWEFVEAFSSADGSIQFMELLNDNFNNQQFAKTNNAEIDSNANTFFLDSDLPSSTTANKTFLVGTTGYDTLAQTDVNVPLPDYIVADKFFSTGGDTLILKQFLGTQTLDTIVFTSGDLPTDGTNSLNHAFGDNTNTFFSATNSPKNFAGDTGTVTLTGPSADFDGDNDVDGDDFLFWQLFLGGADDLALWETQYGLPVPLVGVSAVPEPQSVCLLLCGLLAFCRRCR